MVPSWAPRVPSKKLHAARPRRQRRRFCLTFWRTGTRLLVQSIHLSRRVPEGPNVRQTEPMTVMGTPPWTIGPVRLATDLQELREASEVASLALLSHVSGTRPVPVTEALHFTPHWAASGRQRLRLVTVMRLTLTAICSDRSTVALSASRCRRHQPTAMAGCTVAVVSYVTLAHSCAAGDVGSPSTSTGGRSRTPQTQCINPLHPVLCKTVLFDRLESAS